MSHESAGHSSTEDYGEILLPVSDYTYNEARVAAAEYAEEMLDLWGRSRYEGKATVALHDHDEPWPGEITDECLPTCTMERVWRFETYEGTARR